MPENVETLVVEGSASVISPEEVSTIPTEPTSTELNMTSTPIPATVAAPTPVPTVASTAPVTVAPTLAAPAVSVPTSEFLVSNIQLLNGEFVSKEAFDKLSEEDKDSLKTLGVQGFNDKKAKIQTDFLANNIKLSNDEFISKSIYDALSDADKVTLSELGTQGFNTLQAQKQADFLANNIQLPSSKEYVSKTVYDALTEAEKTSLNTLGIQGFKDLQEKNLTTFLDSNVKISDTEYIPKTIYDGLSDPDKELLKTLGVAEFNILKDKEQKEFLESSIKLDNGEYVSKETYETLSEEDKTSLNTLGIQGFKDAQTKKIEEFQANNIQLSNGDYVPKDDFDKLNADEQQLLKDLGIEAFNTARGQAVAAFTADNVQISDTEWMAKTDYDKLSTEDQTLIKSVGIQEYNRLQNEKLANFESSNVKLDNDEYISKDVYDKLTEEDKALLNSSGIAEFNRILDQRKLDFETANVKLTGTNEWVSKEVYDALSVEDKAYLMANGIDSFEKLQAQKLTNFEEINVKLSDGSYISKATYDAMSETDQKDLMTLGIDEFNKIQAQKKADFEAKNIQISETEWVNKEVYDKLTPEDQTLLKSLGIQGFSDLQEQNRQTFEDNNIKIGGTTWQKPSTQQEGVDIISRVAQGKETTPELMQWADVNRDGVVNLKDITALNRIFLGIDPEPVALSEEWISKEAFNKLAPADQKLLKTVGLTEFNKVLDQRKLDFETINVQIPVTGEWIPKKDYDTLSADDKKFIMDNGLTKFSELQQTRKTEFETKNVQLAGTKEWVPKADYDTLSDEDKKYLSEKGIDAFRTLQEQRQKEFANTHTELSNGEFVSNEEYNKLSVENKAKLSELGIQGFLDYQAGKETEFKANNMLLPSGEWISKEVYDGLSSYDRSAIDTLGIKGFVALNDRLKSEFEAVNIKLNTGEWIPRDYYDKLAEGDKKLIMTGGLSGFTPGLSTTHVMVAPDAYTNFVPPLDMSGTTIIQRVIMGLETDPEAIKWSDRNKDGVVDMADVNTQMQAILGMAEIPETKAYYIPKAFYDALSSEQQAELNKIGLEKFNEQLVSSKFGMTVINKDDYPADAVKVINRNLGDSESENIVTDYILKSEYDKLSEEDKRYLQYNGVNSYNIKKQQQFNTIKEGLSGIVETTKIAEEAAKTVAALPTVATTTEVAPTDFKSANTQLPSGEWISNTDYAKLSKYDLADIAEVGLQGFRDLKTNNVRLNTGEWFPKTEYAKLERDDQKAITQWGAEGFIPGLYNTHVKLDSGEFINRYTVYDKLNTDYQIKLNELGIDKFKEYVDNGPKLLSKINTIDAAKKNVGIVPLSEGSVLSNTGYKWDSDKQGFVYGSSGASNYQFVPLSEAYNKFTQFDPIDIEKSIPLSDDVVRLGYTNNIVSKEDYEQLDTGKKELYRTHDVDNANYIETKRNEAVKQIMSTVVHKDTLVGEGDNVDRLKPHDAPAPETEPYQPMWAKRMDAFLDMTPEEQATIGRDMLMLDNKPTYTTVSIPKIAVTEPEDIIDINPQTTQGIANVSGTVVGTNTNTGMVLVRDAANNLSWQPGSAAQIGEANAIIQAGGTYTKSYTPPTGGIPQVSKLTSQGSAELLKTYTPALTDYNSNLAYYDTKSKEYAAKIASLTGGATPAQLAEINSLKADLDAYKKVLDWQNSGLQIQYNTIVGVQAGESDTSTALRTLLDVALKQGTPISGIGANEIQPDKIKTLIQSGVSPQLFVNAGANFNTIKAVTDEINKEYQVAAKQAVSATQIMATVGTTGQSAVSAFGTGKVTTADMAAAGYSPNDIKAIQDASTKTDQLISLDDFTVRYFNERGWAEPREILSPSLGLSFEGLEKPIGVSSPSLTTTVYGPDAALAAINALPPSEQAAAMQELNRQITEAKNAYIEKYGQKKYEASVLSTLPEKTLQIMPALGMVPILGSGLAAAVPLAKGAYGAGGFSAVTPAEWAVGAAGGIGLGIQGYNLTNKFLQNTPVNQNITASRAFDLPEMEASTWTKIEPDLALPSGGNVPAATYTPSPSASSWMQLPDGRVIEIASTSPAISAPSITPTSTALVPYTPVSTTALVTTPTGATQALQLTSGTVPSVIPSVTGLGGVGTLITPAPSATLQLPVGTPVVTQPTSLVLPSNIPQIGGDSGFGVGNMPAPQYPVGQFPGGLQQLGPVTGEIGGGVSGFTSLAPLPSTPLVGTMPSSEGLQVPVTQFPALQNIGNVFGENAPGTTGTLPTWAPPADVGDIMLPSGGSQIVTITPPTGGPIVGGGGSAYPPTTATMTPEQLAILMGTSEYPVAGISPAAMTPQQLAILMGEQVAPIVAPDISPAVIPSATPAVIPGGLPTVVPSTSPTVVPSTSPVVIPGVPATVVPNTPMVPGVIPGTVVPGVIPGTTPVISPGVTPVIIPPGTTPVIVPPGTVPVISPGVTPVISPPTTTPATPPVVAPIVTPPGTVTVTPPGTLPVVAPPVTTPAVAPVTTPAVVSPGTLPAVTPGVTPVVSPGTLPIAPPAVTPIISPPGTVPIVPPVTTPVIAPPDVTPVVIPPGTIPAVIPGVTPVVAPDTLPAIPPVTTPVVSPPEVAPVIIPGVTPVVAPSVTTPTVTPSVSPVVVPSVTTPVTTPVNIVAPVPVSGITPTVITSVPLPVVVPSPGIISPPIITVPPATTGVLPPPPPGVVPPTTGIVPPVTYPIIPPGGVIIIPPIVPPEVPVAPPPVEVVPPVEPEPPIDPSDPPVTPYVPPEYPDVPVIIYPVFMPQPKPPTKKSRKPVPAAAETGASASIGSASGGPSGSGGGMSAPLRRMLGMGRGQISITPGLSSTEDTGKWGEFLTKGNVAPTLITKEQRKLGGAEKYRTMGRTIPQVRRT